jgi:RNA polymerase sigma factor (sigma-70 family)
MATSEMSEVIQYLRWAVLLRDGAGLTDGQLLADYLSRRDETALAALVRRHGPMVWGVCRRVLCNYHDAEDAFQATFLVLVRKAASIASPEMLANWLYGVAHQTALNARAVAAKRRARERQVTEMPEPAVVQQELWHDLQPLLDQELSRLPDKYRIPIILCDLKGKTRKEAARQLGCPEGTVAGRLARARTMLAKRLARHSLEVSGGALAAVLSQNAASACVPTSVVSSAIKAASLLAAGQAVATGVVSAKVAALTEGVLKTMFMTKVKIGAALLVLIGVVATGAGISGRPVLGGGPAEATRMVGAADQAGKQVADQPALEKAENGVVGVSKKIDAEQNKLTFTVITNGGESVDLTYPMIKGVKAFRQDKERKQIKLSDIKPGTKIHVYVNKEADGSLGRNVMEIVMPKGQKPVPPGPGEMP